jgi:hypothetical protein
MLELFQIILGRMIRESSSTSVSPYRRGVTSTAGYSGTPLARKLGVKPGHRLVIWSGPPGWTVPNLPDDVRVRHDVPYDVQVHDDRDERGEAIRAGDAAQAIDGSIDESVDKSVDVGSTPAGAGAIDVCVAFCRTPEDLREAIVAFAEPIRPAGALWIAWPRKATGHRSDVTENLVRDTALPLGLVDTKVAALDSDWSGLKVVWRRELRQT